MMTIILDNESEVQTESVAKAYESLPTVPDRLVADDHDQMINDDNHIR